MKALLIWEEIPESVKFYLIEDAVAIEKLRTYHGKFLNTGDIGAEEELWLSGYVDSIYDTNLEVKHALVLHEPTIIIYSGIYL